MSAPRATIVVHLPSHRRRALDLVNEGLVAEQAYDANIGDYIDFLQRQAAAAGFDLTSRQDDHDAVFTIDEHSHADKKAARHWLESLPDIWNWMPSA